MAEQFIVGETPEEAVAELHGLWRRGSAATIDLLGEKTVVSAEADRYQARVLELLDALCDAAPGWAPDDLLERDDIGPLARVNVSIKPTALATHYEPLSRAEGLESAKGRIRPILRRARDRGAHVHFDMEHYDAKDLTLSLFRELLGEDEFADVQAGIVIQAVLRDSRDDLADLIAWSSGRRLPITVRLVKGAYWDAETVHAGAAGWEAPVFEQKAQTDANYERCTRLLHDHHGDGASRLRVPQPAIARLRGQLRPAVGPARPRLRGAAALRHGAAGARRHQAPRPAVARVRAGGRARARDGVPRAPAAREHLQRELRPAPLRGGPGARRARRGPGGRPAPRADLPARGGGDEPVGAHAVRPRADAGVAAGVGPGGLHGGDRPGARRRGSGLGIDVPALIDGERVHTSATITSVDPARFDLVVATSASCTAADADAAVAAALRAAPAWRAAPATERAGLLFRAAEWMRRAA